MRLRAAALGLSPPYQPAHRASLRAIGRASLVQGRAHANSRTRRSLVAGRVFAPVAIDGQRGMRMRSVDAARIESVLSRVAGVQEVKASQKTQVVTLTLDTEQVTMADVRQKLDEMGYQPAE